MQQYQLLPNGFVLRASDKAHIPADPGNRDYQAFQSWQAAGNTPDPLSTVPTIADVDAYRDKRLAAGFVDATTGKTYPCDTESRGFLTAAGASAGFARGGPNRTYPLIASDGVVNLNQSDAFSLINDRVMPWVTATVFYARQLKAAIQAGNPPADITQGWP